MSSKRTKSHAPMHKTEFRNMRELMRFSLVELSSVISIPYRTLQDYEYGKRKIPRAVSERMIAELKREQKIMQQVLASIEKRIDRELPERFMSEADDI